MSSSPGFHFPATWSYLLALNATLVARPSPRRKPGSSPSAPWIPALSLAGALGPYCSMPHSMASSKKRSKKAVPHVFCSTSADRCRTNRARSSRSISYGVMHLILSPMQASGILILRVEAEGISCVTTVYSPAFAWATR